MTDRQKVLYILVQDGDTESPSTSPALGTGRRRAGGPPCRYTRSLLQSTLQFMGCKPRHAFKICDRVFDVLKAELPVKPSKILMPPGISLDGEEVRKSSKEPTKMDGKELESQGPGLKKQSSRKRSTVTITREKFLDVVCEALAQYQYVGPNQRADLIMACRVRERKSSVTILLCGTSGCGKSTLSSLLASRLGITTVVSTDSLRHMMRSFVDEKENPLLWASTYHAGECLDLEAVAEAKAKKRAAKMSSLPLHPISDELGLNDSLAAGDSGKENLSPAEVLEPPLGSSDRFDSKVKSVQSDHLPDWADSVVGPKTMALAGYKAQSEMVIDSLDRLLTSWEQKGESVIVEGVHLSLNFVMAMMAKHPSIIPFMVYISNEAKHLERFAVRAKYMTLDPARNKYVKYIRNIRTIQEYLCSRADKFLVPKVNNTNVDKSVAAIHATIFSSLRRREKGEPLFDRATMTVKVVNQEYQNQYAASALSSKYMFQLIQRKGSSRQLMALMNVDGSVAKAWPIVSASAEGKLPSNGDNSEIGSPVYGPIAGEIGTAEPVNLQFGSYGLSAWPNDAGGTSNHGSVDGQSSRGDPYDGSGHGSPYAISPREYRNSISPRDNTDKELIFGDVSVSDSEEEPEEEESKFNSDAEQAEEDEVEGSVDDQSIRSDEDGDDFRLGDDGEEPDDEDWVYDAEEADTLNLSTSEQTSFENNGGGPKVGNDRIRSHGTGLVRSHSGKIQRTSSGLTEEVLNAHLTSSNLTDESADAAKSHLTVGGPFLDTRLHPRARSSTVR